MYKEMIPADVFHGRRALHCPTAELSAAFECSQPTMSETETRQQRLADLNERYLQLAADLENFRRHVGQLLVHHGLR